MQENTQMETLFSFELLVDNINVDRETKVSDELAVALRLLDFPTLIIYQPEHKEVNGKEGEHTFSRGKACFFKMNMDSLHRHLSSTPLYAMVLDVKEEMPKFVGSSQISLANVMHRIRRDVAERGVSTPSSHGQRGTVGISNLKGVKVGTISLSYKLLSLGSSLLPHVSKMDSKHTTGVCLKDSNGKKEAEKLSADSENMQKSNPDDGSKLSKNGEASEQETFASKCQETDSYGEDMSVFCPPHLYYNNSAEERAKSEEEGRKQLKSNLDAFAFEDTEETDKNMHLKEQKHYVANSVQKQQQVPVDVTPNVMGQALQQMPLLNALLVELSLLNSSNANQPLNIHPNLAWIYKPASTETSAVERNTSRKLQNETKNRQAASPKLNDLYSPRHCSTPIQGERRSTPKKKLVYGTTKSFDLRLKQNCPAIGEQRECVGLIEGKTPLNTNRESKVVKKLTKSAKRSTKRSKLAENIETVIRNITAESTLQEVTVENRTHLDAATPTGTPQEGGSIAEKMLLFGSPSRHIPTKVESDNMVKINQSSSDSHTGKHSGSSRSSVDSSVSDRSGGEDDYADDFNSFEPSDAFSPDPMIHSPELQRPKTPKSHSDLRRSSSDSSPESVQRSIKSRPVIPVPIKASRSPQSALRGSYTIQRQTFGVSFSSEDGDRDRASSKLSAYSAKLFRDRSREERSSGESLQSSGDHRSEIDKSRQTIQKISDESSFDHKTEEDDELGTLDFRKGYKHISELVAHKLPGYTM
uniref:Si:ch1073-266p11.2 n=1 Tax=Neogobius melanostomus TaxID=47308 RepID=A0A8C6TC75_9GOBI